MVEAPWPRGMFRQRSEEFELARGTKTREGGEVLWDFADNPPETIRAFLRPPERSEATDYNIRDTGEVTNIEYLLDVLEMGGRSPDAKVPTTYVVDPSIEQGDRVITDEGPYRVIDPSFEHHSGVSRYALIRDTRGSASEGDDGSSSDSPYEIA